MTITATPPEIAALVFALQKRPSETVNISVPQVSIDDAKTLVDIFHGKGTDTGTEDLTPES